MSAYNFNNFILDSIYVVEKEKGYCRPLMQVSQISGQILPAYKGTFFQPSCQPCYSVLWGPKGQTPLGFLLHDRCNSSPSQKPDDNFAEDARTETNSLVSQVQGAKYPPSTKYNLLSFHTLSYCLQFISPALFYIRSSLQCESDPAQLLAMETYSSVQSL